MSVDNGLLTASVEVDALGLHVEDRKIYADRLGHQDFHEETGKSIVGEALIAAERDVDRLDEDLGDRAAGEIAELRRRIRRQYDDFLICADADGFRKISEEARYIRQECSRLRHSDRFRKASLSAELSRLQSINADLLNGDEDERREARIGQLTQTSRHALADGQNDDAQRAIEELRSVVMSALRRQPGFAVAQFEHLAQGRHLAIDADLHDRLIASGITALENEDIPGMRSTIGQLFENRVIQDAPSHDIAALAHLAAH